MNPIDYKLNDPDAMRYALMANDGAGLRRGGAVHRADGGVVWNDDGTVVQPKSDSTALPMEGRATFLPYRDTVPGSVVNQREWGLPGVVAGAYNAFTAPARSATERDFHPGEEAANFALNTAGGGLGLSHAAPAPAGSLGMATKVLEFGAKLPRSELEKAGYDVNRFLTRDGTRQVSIEELERAKKAYSKLPAHAPMTEAELVESLRDNNGNYHALNGVARLLGYEGFEIPSARQDPHFHIFAPQKATGGQISFADSLDAMRHELTRNK
jgi:hypothetical protein